MEYPKYIRMPHGRMQFHHMVGIFGDVATIFSHVTIVKVEIFKTNF
jgi:hypothetical protein